MSNDIIKSHLMFPLNRAGLIPDEHYTIEVNIGSGIKTAIVKFKNEQHKKNHETALAEVAEQQKIKLELKVAA